MERSLPYWKARKIDLRNYLAVVDPKVTYWAELWQAYRFTRRKIDKKERQILVKRL